MRFDIGPIGYGPQPDLVVVTPRVDGFLLTDLLARFAMTCPDLPVGGYAGICPDHFNFGDLNRYYLGTDARQWPEPGRSCLLGCDCGEVGCHPLAATITRTDTSVIWSAFSGSQRSDRRYAGFGPFFFRSDQYRRAVAVVAEQFSLK